ncbi:MAG: SMC-Scp complex subunit ScpB, partial [Planctomycetota bacterium]
APAALSKDAGSSEAVSSEAVSSEADSSEADSSATSGPGPGELLTDDELLRSVTALVYASPEPITLRRIVDLLERPDSKRVDTALLSIAERLSHSGLPLELRKIAGGYHILTTPEMGTTIQRLFKARKAERISGAALETLSVIAYRQPVTKAEIEAIRGVQAGPMLRTLVERGLARVTGRADVPGHPLQYGTTRDFLDRFGLGSLDELPRDAELSKD